MSIPIVKLINKDNEQIYPFTSIEAVLINENGETLEKVLTQTGSVGMSVRINQDDQTQLDFGIFTNEENSNQNENSDTQNQNSQTNNEDLNDQESNSENNQNNDDEQTNNEDLNYSENNDDNIIENSTDQETDTEDDDFWNNTLNY